MSATRSTSPELAEALRAFCKDVAAASDRLGEPLDEVERRLGDLAPAAVDREGVASVRDLHDLRHGGIAPLPLGGGGRERPRHRVILLAPGDQPGAAVAGGPG